MALFERLYGIRSKAGLVDATQIEHAPIFETVGVICVLADNFIEAIRGARIGEDDRLLDAHLIHDADHLVDRQWAMAVIVGIEDTEFRFWRFRDRNLVEGSRKIIVEENCGRFSRFPGGSCRVIVVGLCEARARAGGEDRAANHQFSTIHYVDPSASPREAFWVRS